MSCDSRVREPCKVSEVFAGARRVGRPASVLGALLGFDTHLSGHSEEFLSGYYTCQREIAVTGICVPARNAERMQSLIGKFPQSKPGVRSVGFSPRSAIQPTKSNSLPSPSSITRSVVLHLFVTHEIEGRAYPVLLILR